MEKSNIQSLGIFGMLIIGRVAFAISAIVRVVDESTATAPKAHIWLLDGTSFTLEDSLAQDFFSQVEDLAKQAQAAMTNQRAAQAGLVVPR